MKKLLVFMFLVLAMQAKAQLTMSDVLRIARMPNTPYNINARSFIDARDSLQLMGYPLMRFIPNTAAVNDKFYSFYFQNSGNDKEKLLMESQFYKVGSVQKTVFKVTLNTSDIVQFNAMKLMRKALLKFGPMPQVFLPMSLNLMT